MLGARLDRSTGFGPRFGTPKSARSEAESQIAREKSSQDGDSAAFSRQEWLNQSPEFVVNQSW
jgi:hypothetical protein